MVEIVTAAHFVMQIASIPASFAVVSSIVAIVVFFVHGCGTVASVKKN